MPGKQSCLECRGIAGCVYYMLKFLKRPFAQESHTSYWNTPGMFLSFYFYNFCQLWISTNVTSLDLVIMITYFNLKHFNEYDSGFD